MSKSEHSMRDKLWGSVGSGWAGTFDGEVVSFDVCRPQVIVDTYPGPSGRPDGAVEYGASGGLVSATYTGTDGSVLPVAIAWDARSTQRVNSRLQTGRLRRRRAAVMRQDIACWVWTSR